MTLDPVAGALAANARRDVHAHAATMRQAYRDSFLLGHGCALCPRVEIPPGISDRDREARADSLWRLHWRRMRRNRRSVGGRTTAASNN